VIIVGQNVLAAAADKRSEAPTTTRRRAPRGRQIQEHSWQDKVLSELIDKAQDCLAERGWSAAASWTP